jgi:hypothetical protein
VFNRKKKPLHLVLATVLTAVVAVTAAFSLPAACTPARAADLLSSYEALKNNPANQEFLDRLFAAEAGATAADLESFLHDLDNELREGETLTEANFNSEMFSTLQNVITWREHRTIFKALSEAFSEEISYTLSSGQLHPSLVPLRDAVRDSLLGTTSPDDNSPGDGGSGNGGPGTGDAREEDDKDADAPDPEQDENGTTSPAPISYRFTDLEGHWAQEKVEKMAAAGLVAGVSLDHFEPRRPITRAEFTTLLVRALSIPTSGQLRGRFEDVAASAWYFAPVNAATGAGLVSGVTATRFEPQQPITREQLAVMVAGALEAQGKTTIAGSDLGRLSIFQDRQHISPWAQKGVAATVAASLIQGRPEGTFAPRDHATRAEAATLLYNLMQ